MRKNRGFFRRKGAQRFAGMRSDFLIDPMGSTTYVRFPMQFMRSSRLLQSNEYLRVFLLLWRDFKFVRVCLISKLHV